ncbi:MAG TPA: MarR family transcriptional regulator [Actinophytocola sp.]|uniref:MarR family winged helix-turn-helix transcriptional regulator n=1 Tax=Actinophytocola sp. TaxID=1872138 RepID=UPI002DBCFAB6|nr:MarR family transcriptional regulator [Actinophytocola sp.]HEU5472203.1 MarR family transcriptional regulator [Actinophytocola sp.]
MPAESDPVAALIGAWETELPDVLGPSSELSKRIMVLSGLLAASTKTELAGFGLTAAEFDVLATLRRSGAPYRLKPNELSRSLLLSSGGTSNVINHLVAEGLVEREPDPGDGRSTLTRLTARGIALAEEVVRAVAAAHEELFGTVPPEVLRAATTALRDLQVARVKKKTSMNA